LYDLITFDERIKGLPPKDQFDTECVFSAEVSGESYREFEVDEFGECWLLLYGNRLPACNSEGLQIKDADGRQFWCVFDSGMLISISRIEYVMIYTRNPLK
jgi:hypothetical protein